MRYAGVIQDDVVNGQGVCVSFFTQGCPYHCDGCQNRETWNPDAGKELPEDYIDRVEELLVEDGVFRNLSILGGEPLYGKNIDIVYDLVKRVRLDFPDIKIFIWTGGIFWNLLKNTKVANILKMADVLVDGRFEKDKKDISLFLKGSTNQRVIDLDKTFSLPYRELSKGKVVLYHQGEKICNFS